MSQITVLTGCKHNFENFMAVSNGMAVKFVHDAENKHSENAVWVIVDGVGVIGHVTEGYIPSGFKAYGDEAVRSSDILNGVIRANKEYKAVIDGKRPNGCLIIFKTIEEEVIEEMEEDTMDKWEIGTSEEVYTLVGCGHFPIDKKIGDKVSIGVDNYSIDVNGNIRGTACAFNENGDGIGLFPQTDKKFADCEEMGGKYVSGDEIKSKYASDVLITDGYIIIDISKDRRFIKLGLEPVEAPVEKINNNKEELYMERTIQYGFAKMAELQTLYDAENIVEEVIEPKTVEEAPVSVEDELKSLNKEIRELSKQEEAIKAKKAELMARREELAAINAKKIALIEEIKSGLESLDLSTLEQMKNAMSSSTPEEDTSSSDEEETVSEVVQKVHEGKELTLPEWEEYIETYWKKGFDALREEEGKLNIKDNKAVERFVNKIKRFNSELNKFKSQGYDKILTLYWIKNSLILRAVCKQFNLTATRLTNSCILKENDITFFLEGN